MPQAAGLAVLWAILSAGLASLLARLGGKGGEADRAVRIFGGLLFLPFGVLRGFIWMVRRVSFSQSSERRTERNNTTVHGDLLGATVELPLPLHSSTVSAREDSWWSSGPGNPFRPSK